MCEGLDHQVIALHRVEPPDTADKRGGIIQAEFAANAGAVRARPEPLGVDAIEHHPQAPRVGHHGLRQLVGQHLGHRHHHVRAARRQSIQQAPHPPVGCHSAVIGVDQTPHPGSARRQGSLVPHAAVGVDDVRGDGANLPNQRVGP